MILSKQSNISEAIMRWCYKNVAYDERTVTLYNLGQNGCWIISVNVVVRGMIYRYANCHKLRGKFGVKKMEDLHEVRYLEVPKFTCIGVDMFGLYTIRERRPDLKRYCALLICFASSAVRIEVTNPLDTDSFVQTIQGPVRLIRSDNDASFVGQQMKQGSQ